MPGCGNSIYKDFSYFFSNRCKAISILQFLIGKSLKMSIALVEIIAK
jgi:hypothetical protein